MKTRKVVKLAAPVVAAALVLIQLVPVERTNPPVTGEVPAPPEVRSVLQRACYDCHSNETRWPWYAHVAPVSWLVAHDVEEGRSELNFSTWDRYSEKKRASRIRHSWKKVDKGKMPLWFYLPLHPDAQLSDEDRDALRRWAEDQ